MSNSSEMKIDTGDVFRDLHSRRDERYVTVIEENGESVRVISTHGKLSWINRDRLTTPYRYEYVGWTEFWVPTNRKQK